MLVLLGVFGPVAVASGTSWTAVVPSALNSDSLVTLIDLGTNTAGPVVSTPGASAQLGVAISPDGRTAYSVAAGSHALVAIDLTASPATAGTPVALPGTPAYIAISPDGRKAYVANPQLNELIPVDLTTTPITPGTPIAVGGSPRGVAFSPDGAMAYVANYNDGTVTPITVATNTPESAITGVGTNPDQLAITPDGARAYVTDNGSSNVYPITLASGVVGAPISVGSGLTPLGIAITPDGTKAYIANFGFEADGSGTGDTVTPITLSTGVAGSPITVGGGPWSIAVTPDSKTVYVGNSNDYTVTPIDVATGVAGSAIGGVRSPRSIAITPDQAPVANFAVTSGTPGSATSFDASASTVAVGTIVKFVWDFGDGTAAVTTSTPMTSHVYASAGTYSATVSETDSAGTSSSGEVYTGQTASRVGSSSASTARSVVISAGPQPAVSLSAPGLTFGDVAVGKDSDPQTLRITNTGTGALSLSGSGISGPAARDFTLSADACTGQTVGAGASCTVNVTFMPSAAGARSAQLAFTDNASGSPHTIPLTGNGATLGSVTGHVHDVTNTPASALAGALVSICPRGQNGIELGGANCHTTTTDSSGAYSLPNLRPGPAAIEVHPVSPRIAGGSALLTVIAGPPSVEDFSLHASSPLPNSITITSPNGPTTGGSPVLYWDAPFQLTLPPLIAAPAHATPKSIIVTIVDVSLSSGPTPVIGSSLAYLTLYDGSGNAVGSRAIARQTPGAVVGGFDFTFGGLAIASGAGGAGSSSLGSATQIVAQSGGLHRQVHGTLGLTIRSVRVASGTSPPTAARRSSAGRSSATVAADTGQSMRCELAEREVDGYIQSLHRGAISAYNLGSPDPRLDALLAAVDEFCGPEDPPAPPPEPCPYQLYPCGPVDNIFNAPVAVDPSGFVTTRSGIPLEHARVVLQRSDTATGPFRQLPSGSPRMSASNRRNPDFTDLNGHFGWDVFPGYYRVAASRRGCRGTALSPSSPVPPPVTNLLLKLNCPGLRRTNTHTRILSAVKRGPSFAISMRTLAGRARVNGMVTVSAGRRLHGFGFLDRNGRARILLPGASGRRTRITVRYAGNARFAPSSARAGS